MTAATVDQVAALRERTARAAKAAALVGVVIEHLHVLELDTLDPAKAAEIVRLLPETSRIRKGSVLRYERITGGRAGRHPTEKPVPLLAELVESSSRAGELVLDPCAGVGSTGVAAVLRGRRTLLVEAVDEYARIAVDRIRRAEALVAEAGRL